VRFGRAIVSIQQVRARCNAVRQDRSSQDSLGNEQGEGRKKNEIGKGSAFIA
jgi:hypothetical protein